MNISYIFKFIKIEQNDNFDKTNDHIVNISLKKTLVYPCASKTYMYIE